MGLVLVVGILKYAITTTTGKRSCSTACAIQEWNSVISTSAERLGGKRRAGMRGTGSWGVENAGSGGKHGVWWKTRGPVENAGSGGKRGVWWKMRGLIWKTRGTTIFRQNMNFPN